MKTKSLKVPTLQTIIKRHLAPDSDKWLNMAVHHDKKHPRPALERVHGNIASDGFRYHKDHARAFSPDPKYPPPDFNVVIDKHHPKALVKASRNALILACLRAIAIGRGASPRDDFMPVLRLSVNGKLEYKAISEENGTTSGYIENYHHEGDDLEIGFNPKYLMEAVAGMSEEVLISLKASNYPAYITDGRRSAVVMPMRIEA